MHLANALAKTIRPGLVVLAGVLFLAGVSLSTHKPSAGLETIDSALEVPVMSFNIRYGTANDGANRVRVLECIMFMFYRAMLGIMSGYEKAVSTSAEYVEKLHDGTERICVAKIDSFA